MKIAVLDKIESYKPFTEREAWGLFRIAALSEAAGWTILIAGILIDHFKLPLHNYAVPIAGQIHGMIFLAYFAILLATYTSLGWPRLKFVVAAAAGVPPYGTLVFELWAAHHRRQALGRTNRHALVRTLYFNCTNRPNIAAAS
jgi:integral membrane protein